MATLSISEVTTFRWSFQRDVQTYARLGLTSLGIWRQKLADYGEEKGAELLAESEINVSHVYFAGGFTGHDGRSFGESVEDARHAIEVASLVGADCLTLYTGSRGGHTRNHANRLFETALDQILPVALENEIALAIEPMDVRAADDWTFLTDLEMALELIDRISSPYLKMAIDTYQWGEDPKLFSLMYDLIPHLAIVHLGDYLHSPSADHERCLLGRGIVPLEAIVHCLTENGYNGNYDVRLMGEEIELSNYEDVIHHSCQTFRQVMQTVQAS